MILLPRPKHIIERDWSMTLSPDAAIVLAEQARSQMVAAQQLQEDIRRFAGLTLPILCGEPQKGDVYLCFDPTYHASAYSLEISQDMIVIEGSVPDGILLGVQTLRQIIRQNGGALSCLRVEDRPDYPVRGFYHDVTRGRTPTLAWLKHLADEACFYKLNQLQLYVEHTYLFRQLTEMWDAGEPLTAQEIMELDEYCAQRGIELVPSIATFGHLFELLNTQSYKNLCELPQAGRMPSTMPHRMAHHTLNISDHRALALVKGMIKEYAQLFRSKWFNICADETFDLGKGRGKAAMEEVGEGEYYISFVKELCDYVVSLNRRPMFWGDIVIKNVDTLACLPEGTVCLNWGYSANVEEDDTRALAQAGAEQYVCPGVSGWNQWMNRIRDSYENIRRMAEYGRNNDVVGLLNTDWGDYGHINDPRFSLPGMIFGAQFSWSDEVIPFDEFCRDISRLAYLDRGRRVVELLAQMQDHQVCSWWHIVQHMEYVLGHADEGTQDYLPGMDLSGVKRANWRLRHLENKLMCCARNMDSSTREMIGPWRNAAEAIRLWNQVAYLEQKGLTDKETAAQLERWLQRYEAQWRQVSKESELWRTRNVVHWYAARLRGKRDN